MNLQQLEYLIAVDRHRHFGEAARACHVTQPTLSTMLRKLEEELGAMLFDRSRQPVVPTETGYRVLEQARIVLREAHRLHELARESDDQLTGTLAIGIIPTLAPYLLPYFLHAFLQRHPGVSLQVAEHTTDTLLQQLRQDAIDVALLSIPLQQSDLEEIPLFFEELLLYSSRKPEKQYVLPEDIVPEELWLLEEGHCLRSQILHLCALRHQHQGRLQYRAGSLETLRQLVDHHQGMTILPELAALQLPEPAQHALARFQSPAPVREIGMALHRRYAKRRLVEALRTEILAHLPEDMAVQKGRTVFSPATSQ